MTGQYSTTFLTSNQEEHDVSGIISQPIMEGQQDCAAGGEKLAPRKEGTLIEKGFVYLCGNVPVFFYGDPGLCSGWGVAQSLWH